LNSSGNYNPTEKQTDDSCTRSIGYAINSDWMNSVSKTALLNFDPGVTVGDSKGAMSVDVTSMVKTWLSGARPNNGFILVEAAAGGTGNTECLTSYGLAKLTLQYSQ
jgi:hypothetical protein